MSLCVIAGMLLVDVIDAVKFLAMPTAFSFLETIKDCTSFYRMKITKDLGGERRFCL